MNRRLRLGTTNVASGLGARSCFLRPFEPSLRRLVDFPKRLTVTEICSVLHENGGRVKRTLANLALNRPLT